MWRLKGFRLLQGYPHNSYQVSTKHLARPKPMTQCPSSLRCLQRAPHHFFEFSSLLHHYFVSKPTIHNLFGEDVFFKLLEWATVPHWCPWMLSSRNLDSHYLHRNKTTYGVSSMWNWKIYRERSLELDSECFQNVMYLILPCKVLIRRKH